MAKRYTDTDKWKSAWFWDLPLKGKLTWLCLLDICDHCGIWDVNLKLLSSYVGEQITENEFETWFEGKFKVYKDNKIYFPECIPFQQGDNLNPRNNAHKGPIKFLEELTHLRGSPAPHEGLTRSHSNSNSNSNSNVRVRSEDAALKFDFDSVYKEYPLKKGKSKGLLTFKAQIRTEKDYQSLIAAVTKYRELVSQEATEPRFIKHFDTFMNCWRDYIDPDVGTTTIRPEDRFSYLKENPNAIV